MYEMFAMEKRNVIDLQTKKYKRIMLNENLEVYRPTLDAIKRKAIIDACNIAHASSGCKRKTVACTGLLSLMRYLLIRGFDVYAFIPIDYISSTYPHVEHAEILVHLYRIGLLSFTPSRYVTSTITAPTYDDLYTIVCAHRQGGFIVSGDRFADVLQCPHYTYCADTIRDRRIECEWLQLDGRIVESNGRDRFVYAAPKFIKFSKQRGIDLSRVMYCTRDDPLYRTVDDNRVHLDDRLRSIADLDQLIDQLKANGRFIPPLSRLPISSLMSRFCHTFGRFESIDLGKRRQRTAIVMRRSCDFTIEDFANSSSSAVFVDLLSSRYLFTDSDDDDDKTNQTSSSSIQCVDNDDGIIVHRENCRCFVVDFE